MTPSSKPKVFCIGFHKTGTKSIGHALELLGYRVCGPVGVRRPDIAERALELALATAKDFDAFQDNPWPILFRELDQAFPGSRFILTVRDLDDWLASAVNHFGRKTTPMREWIYGAGAPLGNEARYRARHQAHLDAVRAHFRHRPDDLLEFPLTRQPDWGPLCRFLDLPPPAAPFPALNQRRAPSP